MFSAAGLLLPGEPASPPAPSAGAGEIGYFTSNSSNAFCVWSLFSA